MLLNWVLEKKTFGSPLDCKGIQPVNPKGNQSWIFIGRTDAEAEVPILWPPNAKNWLIGKDPYAVKDWRLEKGMTEDEMVRWHHQLNGHEFEQALGVGDGQESLACCSPWGRKELDEIEWVNWKTGISFFLAMLLSLVWEHGVLTELPGKSCVSFYNQDTCWLVIKLITVMILVISCPSHFYYGSLF